jgi:hypothetical protein
MGFIVDMYFNSPYVVSSGCYMVWYLLQSYRFDKIIATYTISFGKPHILIETLIKDKLIFRVAWNSARHEQSIMFLPLTDCSLLQVTTNFTQKDFVWTPPIFIFNVRYIRGWCALIYWNKGRGLVSSCWRYYVVTKLNFERVGYSYLMLPVPHRRCLNTVSTLT